MSNDTIQTTVFPTRQIKLTDVHENPVALRAVNRESEAYLGLVASIKEKGFISSITVRERSLPDGTKYFELIDGLHRYNAAKDCGIETINAVVVPLDDAAVLEAQILANVHKVETRPVEYTKQLLRILAMNQTMTESELARKLGKSSEWINQRLSLIKISDSKIQGLINEDRICLSNAYALAKLPVERQVDMLDSAMTDAPKEFTQKVAGIMKEIRDARRKGLDGTQTEWQPIQFLRKPGEFKEEMATGATGKQLVAKFNITDPAVAFALAIQWAMNADPDSIAKQKMEEEQREKQKAEAKERREKEAAEKKAERAKKLQEEAAALGAEAAARLNG